MPLVPTQTDRLLEVLERVLDKGVVIDAFVVRHGGIDMGPVRLVLTPNDEDDDGGDGGAAAQMRPLRYQRLMVVSPALQRRDRS